MHQLHGEIQFTLAVPADLIGGYGIGMLQKSRNARFTKQALLLDGIVGKLRTQGFVANDPGQMQIFTGHDQ